MEVFKETVALCKCNSYQNNCLEDVIDRLAGAAQFRGEYHGKTILLKPNLISTTGPALACTDGQFIGVVAAWFKEHGARVIVGDSPAFGTARKVCEKFGITQILKKLDVQIVNFDCSEKLKLSGGTVLPIARQVLECDLLVGLPKIKAHNQMFVTLAIKNVFGIVTGMNKALLHMVHGNSHEEFAEIILDLLAVLPPHLHIADGIEIMHRSGPLDGQPLEFGCVAASHSPLALDTAILSGLDLDANKSPLWAVARTRGYAESSIENLLFPLEKPETFQGSGFQAPEELNGIRFNPLRFLSGTLRRGLLKLRC